MVSISDCDTTGETASPPGESAFGRWVFDPTYSRNPASPGGTGETIATMLLGYPIAIRRDVFLPGTATLRTNEMNFYRPGRMARQQQAHVEHRPAL